MKRTEYQTRLLCILFLLLSSIQPIKAQGSENAIAAGIYLSLIVGFIVVFGGTFLLFVILGFLFASGPDKALRKKVIKNSALYSFLTTLFLLLLTMIVIGMFWTENKFHLTIQKHEFKTTQ